jgi:Ca-activated chloride channel family protein
MQQFQDRERPGYLIFLTDGLPTVGEKNSAKIAQNARQWNESRIRLFTFGVGYDVNSRLLDRLVNDNHGQSAFVRPNEDIEQHVGKLARRIESPVLTNVNVRFEIDGHQTKDGPIVNRIYPGQGLDLFAGEQLVLVGRYSRPGAAKVVVKGTLNGETKKYDYRAKLRKKSQDQTHSFVEKLWAIRRVGEIIDEIDLHGSNDELIDELTGLSKQHGIMTPYTSFLAEEDTNLNDRLAIRLDAAEALSELRDESGQAAFRQRAAKGLLRRGLRVTAQELYSADSAIPDHAAPTAAGVSTGLAGRAGGLPALQSNLTHAGDKAFYYREGRWMDSEIEDTKTEDAIRIERFTPEYFDLAERLGKRVTRYLALEGDVYFELDGAKYLVVNPAPPNGQ